MSSRLHLPVSVVCVDFDTLQDVLHLLHLWVWTRCGGCGPGLEVWTLFRTWCIYDR